MGTTIHTHIEVKRANKGLPNDLSEITAFYYKQDRKSCRLHDELNKKAMALWEP